MSKELESFSKALERLEGMNVGFWLNSKGQEQFWLDRKRYEEMQALKRERRENTDTEA